MAGMHTDIIGKFRKINTIFHFSRNENKFIALLTKFLPGKAKGSVLDLYYL